MRKTLGIAFAALFVVAAMSMMAAAPAKTSPQAKTTIYAAQDTFGAAATPVDTITWTKARGFADTSYTCTFIATGGTATGVLRTTVLNDSAFLVSTSAATDSNKTLRWMAVVQKH